MAHGHDGVYTSLYNDETHLDKVENVLSTKAEGMWSASTGTMTTFFTGSTQDSNTGKYYYDVHMTSNENTQAEFAVTYGHRAGSGSEAGNAVGITNPTKGIYSQFRQVLLPPETTQFNFHGDSGVDYKSDSFFAIVANRARYREKMDPGNWELHLGGHKTRLTGQVSWSNGATTVSGSGTKFLTELTVGNTVTIVSGSDVSQSVVIAIGSDVSMSLSDTWDGMSITGSGTIDKHHPKISLIDDSGASRNATIASSTREFWVVSGSISAGVAQTPSASAALGSGSYGIFYPETGMILLNPNILARNSSSSQVIFNVSESTNSNGLNHRNLFSAVSGAGYFTARREEQVRNSYYFCRVQNNEFNHSQNPSYFSGSGAAIINKGFIKEPKSYITTIGLYNNFNELLAVAKLSKPLLKDMNTEALFKVKLEY